MNWRRVSCSATSNAGRSSINGPDGPHLPPLREVISRHGLDAKRSLGQHFLLDANITARIVREAGTLDGRDVVEVGPGPGGLTRALLATGARRVIAIELDRRAIGALEELRAVFPERLEVIEGDAHRRDLSLFAAEPRQIIANLPYNVASPLLVSWLRQAAAWEQFTLMFQLEVAERICAAPGEDAYGRLGVLAQFVCEVGLRLRIPPTAFVPPPKIWSAVVCFQPRPEQPSPGLFSSMERVTAAAFGQRRKMLRGSLKSLGGEALLARANIDPVRRAETLSVTEFATLARLVESGLG